MKLRYHLEKPCVKVEAYRSYGNVKAEGILVLETEPARRSICAYSQTRATSYVPFPYVYFVRYLKTDKVTYPGIYASGLRVFISPKRLESFDDTVFYPPTDSQRKGLVCTDHSKDGKQFKSVAELGSFVVTMWWNHNHAIEYQPFQGKRWHEATMDDLPKASWTGGASLKKSLVATRSIYGGQAGGDTDIPNDAVFIDEQWPLASLTEEFKGVESKNKPVPATLDPYGNPPCDCYECRLARGEI